MNNSLAEKMEIYAPALTRKAVALVFLWFGTQQLLHTAMWTGLIPEWFTSMSGISAIALVHFNGSFEIVFGLALLAGYFTRVTALLLGLHLLSIVFDVGFTAIGIRDFGLSMATLSVFLYGPDYFTIDEWMKRKKGSY